MASKSKKRRRVLGASCILAALIIAGSSFAWFTSSDEVTNRLSASADYGAKIVESFAPPANWLPGQEVNKDVYVTNTGNIGAFVGMDVSGTLSIKKDMSVAVPTTTTINKYTIHYNDGTAQTEDLLPDDYAAKVAVDTNAGKTYYTPDPTNAPDTKYEVTQTDVDSTTVANDGVFDCVELTNDERYAVEAGAYLAYKPAADVMNELGRQAVNYKGTPTTTYVYTAFKAPNSTQLVTSTTKLADGDFTANPNTATDEQTANNAGYTKKADIDGTTYYFKDGGTTPTEITSNGTDFTPRADGLYVFRRSIDVDAAGFGADEIGKGAESFTYDGYYYYGGKYYKIADLSVTPDDVADIAGDTVQTDGNLAAASANLVKEVTDYANPVDLEYDNANHRLIATYSLATSGLDTALTNASNALDAAEHEYAAAELALRRAIVDAASEDAAVKATTAARDQAQKARDDAKDAYDKAKAKFEALKQRYNDAKDEFDAAQSAVASDIADLVGTGSIAISSGTGSLVDRATAGTAADGSKAKAYADAETAYNTFVANHTLPLNYGGDVTNIEHIYITYLEELSEDTNNTYTLNKSNAFSDPTHPTATELEAEIAKAVGLIGYDKLSTFNPTGDAEIHDFHALLTAKKLATDNYEAALQKYVDDVAKLNNVINSLNNASPNTAPDPLLAIVNTTTAQTKAGVEALDATKSKLYAEALEARADYDGGSDLTAAEGTGGKAGVLAAAEAALLEAEKDLKDATNNVEGNDDVKQSLEDAWKRYYEAKNALYAAEKAKEDAQKKYDENADLKIYIYLKNDVLVGGENGKWQIDPTTIGADETAHFYYTNILKGGQTSEQLIDKVVLDSRVTQDMYKYFDFDLNVAMNSAQIVYAADNKTILTTPATEEMHKTATLTDPTNIDTPITWSGATPAPAGGGSETPATTNVDVIVDGATAEHNLIKMVKTGTGDTATWAVADSGSTITDAASGYHYTVNGSGIYRSVTGLTVALNAVTGDTTPVVAYVAD